MEEQEGIEEQEDPVHIQSSLFQGDSGAVVVLLDRREDSATPLLTQWTYQAMVYKLLGLTNSTRTLAPSCSSPRTPSSSWRRST